MQNKPIRKYSPSTVDTFYNHIPQIECIYSIIHNNKIIYLGQTKNLRLRLIAHITSANQFEKWKYLQPIKEEISYNIISLVSNHRLKEFYIKKYNPLFNRQNVIKEKKDPIAFKRKVRNITTGAVYNSISSAARSINNKKSTLVNLHNHLTKKLIKYTRGGKEFYTVRATVNKCKWEFLV